jgi:hypothetical protein
MKYRATIAVPTCEFPHHLIEGRYVYFEDPSPGYSWN